ncbi:MAG: lipoyl domain-containing protein [Caulobacteraceae bacterium]|nr:lipoyl domain-containing protein [Caulobacteraceae bacterium]
MSVEVLLPKLGFSMDEGTVVEWLAADGAKVAEGAPLFVLESDKSSNEIESPASGVLKIIGAAGETFPVGAVIGLIE